MFRSKSDHESLLGDFDEIYDLKLKSNGSLKACLWYWLQVLKAIPAFINISLYRSILMFRNYLKLSLRNFRRQKGYALINMTGLAVGVACTILIMLWVQHELSYDTFHENKDELYIVVFSNGSETTPPPVGQYLKTEYPEIIEFARLGYHGAEFDYKDKSIQIGEGKMVDPAFLKMMTFNFIKGDAETALSEPGGIILTASTAELIFGSEEPFGKVVKLDNSAEFKITGIIEDYPDNSDLTINYLLNFNIFEEYGRDLSNWEVNFHRTYVQAIEKLSIDNINNKITDVVTMHKPQEVRTLSLRSLLDQHFVDSSEGVVYAFSLIAMAILMIACINFINLTTARSAVRAREVGLRKTVGGRKKDLIMQFFSESLFITITSVVIGIIFALLFMPVFNQLSGKHFTPDSLYNSKTLTGIILITSITGLISGSYPALLLSSFQPVKVLKGIVTQGKKGELFRKVLVITQFSMSVFLILGTLIIYKQIDFMKNRNPGFSKDNILVTRIGSRLRSQYDSFKSELLQNPSILSMTVTNCPPYRYEWDLGIGDIHWEGKINQKFSMVMNTVDHDYLKTFGMELKEGRFFSKDLQTDMTDAFVINEAAARVMEEESPIGKQLGMRNISGRIIGVVKDYNFESLHNSIRPMAMKIIPEASDDLCIKIRPENTADIIEFIKSKWLEVYPEYEFSFYFLDDRIRQRYSAEESVAVILKCFMIFAIGISCLGLFGLSAFTAEKRKKEIGIRKVLGASASNISVNISKEIVKWVSYANLLAWPAAWFFMKYVYLQNYEYQYEMGIGIFMLAGISAMIIALITVSYQVLRSAFANPVDSLRYE
ncbi:MAG: FtsX-like permease family protein [bacterium]|nr:FtsX-like permease family protein [bacterium]